MTVVKSIRRLNLKLSTASLLILIYAGLAMAQDNSHICEVKTFDLNTDSATTLGKVITDLGNKEGSIKSFKLPDTKLSITARYLYKPSIPQDAANSISEVILTLVIGKKDYKYIEKEMRADDVVSNATTITPAKLFEKAMVQTTYLKKPQPVIVSLECEKQ